MGNVIEKFDRLAAGYREHDYADPDRYFARKAELVVLLPPRIPAGSSVLDLGCGDGALAPALARYGVDYTGVDLSSGMIDAARRREPRFTFVHASMEDFMPDHPVDVTVSMRAFFYPADVRAFFTRVQSYTRLKFVFDFDPRVHSPSDIRDDLAAAGFNEVTFRRLLLPQRKKIPLPVQAALFRLEPTPVAALLICVGFPARTLVTAV